MTRDALRTRFLEALAEGKVGDCFVALQEVADAAPDAFPPLVRAALDRGETDLALAAVAAWQRCLDRLGRSLPAIGHALAVRANLRAGRIAEAYRHFDRGSRLDPGLSWWDRLRPRFGGVGAAWLDLDEVATALDRDGLAAARAMVEGWFSSVRPDWVAVALASDRLDDPVGVLIAEEQLGHALHAAIPAEVPEALVAAGFAARMRLFLAEEALALAAGVLDRPAAGAEGVPQSARLAWRLNRLRALASTAPPERTLPEALALYREGAGQSLSVIADCLLDLNETDRLGAFLVEAEAAWTAPDRRTLERAQLLHAARIGDRERAAALLRRSEAAGADEAWLIGMRLAVARSLSDAAALHALLDGVGQWRERPERSRALLAVAAEVVAAHHHILRNWPRVEGLVRWLAGAADLPQPAVRTLARCFYDAGRTAEGAALLRRGLVVHPRAPQLWLALLDAELQAGDAEMAAATRARMRAALPPRVLRRALALVDPRMWDEDDVPEVVAHVAGSRSANLHAHFLRQLPRLRLGDAQLDALAASGAVSPAARALLEMHQMRARDCQLLEQSTLVPVPFDAFLESRRAGAARIAAALAPLRAAPDGPPEHAATLCARGLDRLARIGARPGALLDISDSYAEALALARLLIGRIRAAAATSVLRVGDGEALFLPAAPELAGAVPAAREALMRIWWGERRPEPAALAAMIRDHAAAVRNASVVGIIPAWRLIGSLGHGARPEGNWAGACNAIAYADDTPPPDAVVTSAHLHHDLQAWNLWREVFGEVESLSWISCHDLAPWLLETWGVRTRQGVTIPGEDRFFGAFGRFGGRVAAGGSLPDRHDAVRAALAPLAGEVWLVAAGFLGKIYCEDIRRRGGIAIDIGSLADYWMGFATRQDRLQEPLPFTLTNTLLTGHGIPPRDERARILGAAGPVRSTRRGRYNIAAALPAPEPAQSRRFLQVIGHPRCASGFMAGVFAANGIEIGHERLLRDGIASWMNVVRDAVVPYGDNGGFGIAFAHTVVHVRDPAAAIPSIMLENGVERSFDFRRQHILRETGDDIAAHRCALARAVASYLGWYAIALRVPGAVVIRVEDAARAVPGFLAGIGRGPDGAQAPPQPGGSDPAAPVNVSARKFTRPKPVPSRADYAGLEPRLRAGMRALLPRLGYACDLFGA